MFKKEVDKILADTKRSLIEQYLEIQTLAEDRFGPDTVVLMEIGSFFEVYGVDNSEGTIGKSKEIAEILNIQLTRKNKTIPENSVKNPLLAGFPTAAFERYISRIIQEEKYTLVIVRQEGVPPKVTRYMDRVLSPGVNFDFVFNTDTACTTSLVVDLHNKMYSVGYASVDITTGKTFLMEAHSTSEDPTFALDEVFHTLQTYHATECIITTHDAVPTSELIEYLELHNHNNITIRQNRASLEYQNALFQQVYSIESLLSPIEYLDLERTPLASESLALLLDFVIEHDAELLTDIAPPEIINSNTHLYLGNNPLKQLHIISENPHDITILKLFDYTVTSGGKRLLRERLLHPITNHVELEHRYTLVDLVRPMTKDLRQELKHMYDIERLARRITLGRLHPFEINFLNDSLHASIQIAQLTTLSHPTCIALQKELRPLQSLIQHLKKTFAFETTNQLSIHDVNTTLFQTGVDEELDILVQEQQTYEQRLESIKEKIVTLLKEKTQKEDGEFVTIKKLDKEGHFFSVTKNRYYLIEKELQEQFFSINETVYSFGDFHYKIQTGNVKITGTIIDELSERIVALEQKIIARTKALFQKQLECIHTDYGHLLHQLALCLAQIDVAVSTACAADSLQLIRPEIVETTEQENILEAIQLRHPLVEANQDRGIYVPNDIVMGSRKHISKTGLHSLMTQMREEEVRGALLYGINSSGKSSLMKSIGISIILAQSGLFVPAQSFRFSLFTELCTRIVAQDNVMQGLSSFAVEMLELKNIFRRCSPRSLVLGDEISHGTETISAIAIVASAVLRLSEMGGLFIFATHLHQLQEVEEIQKLKHVIMMHLSVQYDKQNDTLLFERFLQPGSGNAIYGLEFAQSLDMDKTFLKRAMTIRKTLTNDFDPLERLQKQETSKYNTTVFLVRCALCHSPVDDTHHIQEQHTADEKGFIDHFPKDHKGNIIPLCKSCHNKVHTGEITLEGYMMTSKGLILQKK